MKKELTVIYDVKLEYNENSVEFNELLLDYSERIDRGADGDDMLGYIAEQVVKNGADHMIEGIGYLSVDGKIKGDPYSGIDVKAGFDDPNVF